MTEIEKVIIQKVKDGNGKWKGLIKGEEVEVRAEHGKYFVSPITSNGSTELGAYLEWALKLV